MFIICRSPKGGVGTSVVAAALALRHAHAGHPTVLVDLAGDQPDLLGVSPSSSLGIGDWAAGGDDVPVEALTALLLPVVAVALLAVIQVGLLVHARVMVTHAAREGVRVAATGGDHGEITEAVVASGRLPPQRLEVEVVPGGGRVTVVVRFDAPTNVPIVGALVCDLALDAEATMRLER